MAGKINILIYIIYDILSNLENGHAIAWLFNMLLMRSDGHVLY